MTGHVTLDFGLSIHVENEAKVNLRQSYAL